jgi:hypothetical protein
MRRKFKIFYPKTHVDPAKAGSKYKPLKGHMVVMNNAGVFFLYDSEPYYPSIRLLSDVIGSYDVVWNGDNNS